MTAPGQSDVHRYIADTPRKLANLLRGAARAGAAVVLDEAKARVTSEQVGEALISKVSGDTTRVVAKISVKSGWARSIGIWLEYGTSRHLITVDASQRSGRSVNRINRLAKEGDNSHSLVIGGQFVGAPVLHPGARPHPCLRVSLDIKRAEAMAAAQSYIDSRVRTTGVTGAAEDGSADA